MPALRMGVTKKMAGDRVCGMEMDEKDVAAVPGLRGENLKWCGCKKTLDEPSEKNLRQQHG